MLQGLTLNRHRSAEAAVLRIAHMAKGHWLERTHTAPSHSDAGSPASGHLASLQPAGYLTASASEYSSLIFSRARLESGYISDILESSMYWVLSCRP